MDIKLKIMFETQLCTDDWDYYSNDNKKCCACDIIFSNIYKQYIAFIPHIQKKCKVCFLCYIILNFNKYYINNVILAISDLNQIDINKKTIIFFNEHNFIPIPSDIDKKVKLVKMQVYEFVQMFTISDDKIFNNYKIFFTNNVFKGIKLYKKPVKNLFTLGNNLSSDSNDTLSINDYYELPYHKFTDDEHYIISKLRKKIKSNNNKESIIIKKSLDDKHYMTELILNQINLLKFSTCSR